MTTLVLPQEYGYVVGVAAASYFAFLWLGSRVVAARKKYKVDLPAAYADQAAAEKDPGKKAFNCIQRGHQNALETLPHTLAFLLIGGVKHPLIASGAGLLWIAGRVGYMAGYASGIPDKRYSVFGGLHWPGQLVLMLTATSFGLSLLKFI